MAGSSLSDPDNLCSALARQKWIILGCVLLSLVAAVFVGRLLPPEYVASARVMVNSAKFTSPALATEAEIIKSNLLVEDAIASLHLVNDIELTGQKVDLEKAKFMSLSLGPAPIPPAVIENFRNRLDVQPVVGSYVLVISYRSVDPEKAAQIVNLLAEMYVGFKTETSPGPAPAAPKVVYEDIEKLKADIAANERELDALKKPNSKIDRLLAEQAELAKRYGPKHPRMIDINKRIEMQSDTGLKERKIRELTEKIEQQRKSIFETSRSVDPQYLRSKAPPVIQHNAKIVSPALVPSEPLRTVPGWVFAVAPFFGLLLGLFLAGINEQLDRGLKSARELEALSGSPVAVTIPVPKDASAGTVLQKPSSQAAESVRSLRAALKLIGERDGRSLRIVTVTSPQDREPRSLVAVWLARLAARAGEKVLLVDVDLRNPQLHGVLNRSNTPSLVDYLTGQNYLEQIIWKQDPSGAHVIFGSSVPNTALDLIGSEKMKKLLNYLRQGYDLVIMCAPPCLGSADASLLANESDQALYVVEARKSSRAEIVKGLKLFSGFGYTAVSTVLVEPAAKV